MVCTDTPKRVLLIMDREVVLCRSLLRFNKDHAFVHGAYNVGGNFGCGCKEFSRNIARAKNRKKYQHI